MNFDEYQKEAKKTAIYPVIGHSVVYPALGLAGESGEVLENIKKMFRDDGVLTDYRRIKILKELGDVLWYLSQIATELNLSLDVIATHNIHKLRERQRSDMLHGEGDNR